MEVSATKFVRFFASIRDKALHEPVVVKDHKRIVGAFVSEADLRMIQAVHSVRRAYWIEETPRYMLDAMFQDLDELKRQVADEAREQHKPHYGVS